MAAACTMLSTSDVESLRFLADLSSNNAAGAPTDPSSVAEYPRFLDLGPGTSTRLLDDGVMLPRANFSLIFIVFLSGDSGGACVGVLGAVAGWRRRRGLG